MTSNLPLLESFSSKIIDYVCVYSEFSSGEILQGCNINIIDPLHVLQKGCPGGHDSVRTIVHMVRTGLLV